MSSSSSSSASSSGGEESPYSSYYGSGYSDYSDYSDVTEPAPKAPPAPVKPAPKPPPTPHAPTKAAPKLSWCYDVLKKFKTVRYLVNGKPAKKYDGGLIFYTEDPLAAVVDYCKKNNCLFRDFQFQPNDASLYGGKGHTQENGYADKVKAKKADFAKRKAYWARPQNFMVKPALYVDGVKDCDIQQGAVGDCWFLAFLSTMGAMAPNTIEGMIKPNVVSEYGVYSVGLHINGVRRYVLVDDLFLVGQDKLPIYCQGRNVKNELWPLLLEKVLAKWCGSYLDIEGGFICFQTAMTLDVVYKAFTGGTVSVYEKYQLKDEAKFITTMEKLLREGFCVMTSSRKEQPNLKGLLGSNNIVTLHMYSLLAIWRMAKETLVCVRNPWGKTEWNGRWADGSKEWNDLGANPKKLKVTVADDGKFWMSTKDFIGHFEQVWAVGPGLAFYNPKREAAKKPPPGVPAKNLKAKPVVAGVSKPNSALNKAVANAGGSMPVATEVPVFEAAATEVTDVGAMDTSELMKNASSILGGENWDTFRKNFDEEDYLESLGVSGRNGDRARLPDGHPGAAF